jgi:excinuclease ABC subunit C
MAAADVKDQVAMLPDQPGVYKFFNEEGTLIYVGKAKSLRKRVGSYFTRQSQYTRKTEKLVSEIKTIEYTLAPTEFDALLLENNLIKQNQPKYNILLKDDKTFPYICILKEPFPRIIYTRKYVPSKGEYFGPYSSVAAMKNVLDLARQLYSIRTCNLQLTPQNIEGKKLKVCLEYHIGNCKGPCEALQTESSYLDEISQARNILKGNLSFVEAYFQNAMQQAAADLKFEQAARFKHKLELLEKFQVKSLVVNRKLTDIDVITIASTSNEAFVNYMLVKEGAIVFAKNVEVKKKLDEPDEDILTLAWQELRSTYRSTHAQVFSNVPFTVPVDTVELVVPQIGDKRKLVALSLKNALHLKTRKETERAEKKERKNEILSILQKDLRLQNLPYIIECFDNSNFLGTSPVASMVRFVNGKPDKSGYRHFNIKTVQGPDDFASMKEIVGRRYSRLTVERKELPHLIVVDGGKGQLASAREALQELGLYGRIPIIGIAKRLEEIYYPEDPLPLLISKKSPGLRLLQHLRDEAHRFAIAFHRQKRSKANMATSLDAIKGIGKKTADSLLQHYKSWKKIKEAPEADLAARVGAAKARLIKSA